MILEQPAALSAPRLDSDDYDGVPSRSVPDVVRTVRWCREQYEAAFAARLQRSPIATCPAALRSARRTVPAIPRHADAIRRHECRAQQRPRLAAMQDKSHADEASATFEELTVWPAPSPFTYDIAQRADAASTSRQ
jgi:hypothetical protein